ncbi:MAG: hypothetical protein IJU26_06495 [Synergistaceae bacterium]|nr:hypothetical protein [Synergistaceae bacterium]
MHCITLFVGTSAADTRTCTAKGFGGNITVTLTLEGGVITGYEVQADSETPATMKRCKSYL